MIPKTFEQTNTKHTESAREHNCASQIHGKTERKKGIFLSFDGGVLIWKSLKAVLHS